MTVCAHTETVVGAICWDRENMSLRYLMECACGSEWLYEMGDPYYPEYRCKGQGIEEVM